MFGANDDAVLRFAFATYAMKRSAVGASALREPPIRVSMEAALSPTLSPNSPAAVPCMAPNVISIHEAENEWAEDDLLTTLHGCLQYLQDTREEPEGGDREEEATRVSQLLNEFVSHSESRERLLSTLVDALVACEEGEEDSPLIECVAQGETENNKDARRMVC